MRESKKAVGRRLKIIAGIIVVSVAVISIFWALVMPALPKKNKIAIIELRGELTTGEESTFYTTTGELQRSLENARRDKSIKAVVLAVDSPGGYATASYEMYSMVKRFEKPVVAFVRGAAASGSYLVSLGADVIVAHPFSEVGSIGVYIELGEPVPVEPENVEAITAISSGIFKTLWEDGVLDENEREFLRLKVEEAKNSFFNIVIEETEIMREKIENVAENIENPWYVLIEGGWFNGNKAFELGLVDKLGDLEDAIELACELAGIEYAEAEVVKIEPPPPGAFENMLYETPLYQQEDNEALPIYLG
ncbi:MAG: S49 family peptidase [Hadesarchaea archaeon]|nr:MAG: S49 family peptidase [Hadesarchaea archaeon]